MRKSNEKTKQEIVSLNSIKPRNFVIDNTKVMNEIADDLIGNPTQLDVGRSGKEILIIVESYFDRALADKNYTNFDRCVYNGIATLWEAGNEYFTPEMVWRAITGDTKNTKPAPQLVGAITKSIEKQRKTHIELDYTAQAQAYKKEVEEFTVEGPMIAADRITVKVSGIKKRGYRFLRSPLLYDYSKLFNQVISVPIKLLQTSDELRSTEDVIVIREYLICQIEMMKHPKTKRNNHIRYDGIYELLGVTEDAFCDYPKKIFKVRKYTKNILDVWVEQKYIKSGRNIVGIEIKY